MSERKGERPFAAPTDPSLAHTRCLEACEDEELGGAADTEERRGRLLGEAILLERESQEGGYLAAATPSTCRPAPHRRTTGRRHLPLRSFHLRRRTRSAGLWRGVMVIRILQERHVQVQVQLVREQESHVRLPPDKLSRKLCGNCNHCCYLICDRLGIPRLPDSKRKGVDKTNWQHRENKSGAKGDYYCLLPPLQGFGGCPPPTFLQGGEFKLRMLSLSMNFNFLYSNMYILKVSIYCSGTFVFADQLENIGCPGSKNNRVLTRQLILLLDKFIISQTAEL